MKKRMGCLCILFIVMTVLGCASSTTLKSLPAGAKVYSTKGALLGVTPYSHWDRNLSNAEQKLVLVADGYKSRVISIKKDCLYIHRLFTPPVLALPWLLGYDVEYTFELENLPLQDVK